MTIKSKLSSFHRSSLILAGTFGAAAAIAAGGMASAGADPQIFPDPNFGSHWEDVHFTPDGGYDKIACRTMPNAGMRARTGAWINPVSYSRICVSTHYTNRASFDAAMGNLPHFNGDSQLIDYNGGPNSRVTVEPF